MSTTTPPRTALILGYAGLLPVIALCLVVIAGPAELREAAMRGHAIYAASILSFIGGAWWGLACTTGAPPAQLELMLILSVLPSIAGWLLAWIGGFAGMLGLSALFIMILSFDAHLVRARLAPSWWMRLRTPLSISMSVLAAVTGLSASLG